jgi:hypothetical protein
MRQREQREPPPAQVGNIKKQKKVTIQDSRDYSRDSKDSKVKINYGIKQSQSVSSLSDVSGKQGSQSQAQRKKGYRVPPNKLSPNRGKAPITLNVFKTKSRSSQSKEPVRTKTPARSGSKHRKDRKDSGQKFINFNSKESEDKQIYLESSVGLYSQEKSTPRHISPMHRSPPRKNPDTVTREELKRIESEIYEKLKREKLSESEAELDRIREIEEREKKLQLEQERIQREREMIQREKDLAIEREKAERMRVEKERELLEKELEMERSRMKERERQRQLEIKQEQRLAEYKAMLQKKEDEQRTRESERFLQMERERIRRELEEERQKISDLEYEEQRRLTFERERDSMQPSEAGRSA